MFHPWGGAVQKPDITTRAVAAFIDLLVVIGLSRLPDVLGFLSASGYILVRDGLFDGRSIGKRLADLAVVSEAGSAGFRDSLIRNATLEIAYILFLIPYAGWLLGPVAVVAEGLTALGDDKGQRIGDIIAGTWVISRRTAESASVAAVREEAQTATGQDSQTDSSADVT